MKTDSLEYEIIDECKCGHEELFILVSLVDFSKSAEIDRLIKALVLLLRKGLLYCEFGGKAKSQLSENELNVHLDKRIKNGEDLESYPSNGMEYSFNATKEAIGMLEEKDRPVKL